MSEVSSLFVILMGMGVVFTGLICIVFLVTITGKIVQTLEKNRAEKNPTVTVPTSPVPTIPVAISNRGELVAAISAVLAEELGTTVSGLRILSLKRLGAPTSSPRGELVAAVSAAIAEDMGTNPAGLRILSMKQL